MAAGDPVGGWLQFQKVVFCDPRYPVSMVEDPHGVATELATDAGFLLLGARELGEWMEAWTAHGADGAVCVLTHGIAPDTIAEEPSRSSLARRYLDSGGRLVWLGDTPFYYQGRPGKPLLWGLQGLRDVLDLGGVAEAEGGAVVTEEGKDWGLAQEAEPASAVCVPARDVTVALSCGAGSLAGSFLKNYSPGRPMGGFLRLLAGPYRKGALSTGELTRVCLHGLQFHRVEAAAEAPETYPGPGGALVESGSFRVDREKALEKLGRFQLPDPGMYLLPWIRCAVAGDATEIRLSRTADGLQMSFNGRPLEAHELKDPYGALFEGGLDKARYRQLAVGLLAAFRLTPKRITVSSGTGADRFMLALASPRHEALEPKPGPVEATVITIAWESPVFGRPEVGPHLDYVRDRFDASRCGLCIDEAGSAGELAFHCGRPKPAGPEPGLGVRFDDEGVSGWIEVPEEPLPVSKLDSYAWGVYVGPVQLKLTVPQVRGRVGDDAFTLNASQTGVVDDGRLQHAKLVLARQGEKLLLEVLEGFRKDFAETGRLLYGDGSLRRHWVRAVDLCEAPQRRPSAWAERLGEFFAHLEAKDLSRHEEESAFVARCARLAVWLREAAQRLVWGKTPGVEARVADALWEAPLYLDVLGRTMSLKDIVEAKNSASGLIEFATRTSAKGSWRALWRLADLEHVHLSEQFGDALTDATDQA